MKASVRAAMIAAIYVVLTVTPPLYSLSYGPIQVRVSELLTVLPFVFPEAVWGLGIGCFLANLAGGVHAIDIVFGSALTLAAAYLTTRVRWWWLAPLPPVLLNGFGVSLYLSYLFKVPYGITVLYILAGQTVACYGIGLPVLGLVRRHYPGLFPKEKRRGLPRAGALKG